MAVTFALSSQDANYICRALAREMRSVNKKLIKARAENNPTSEEALTADGAYLVLLAERFLTYRKEIEKTEFKLKVRRV